MNLTTLTRRAGRIAPGVRTALALCISFAGSIRAAETPPVTLVLGPEMGSAEIESKLSGSDSKGAVYFKPGLYVLDRPLPVQSGRTYIGAGGADQHTGSVLLQTAPGRPVFKVEANCPGNLPGAVTITGLTFDGAPGADAKGIGGGLGVCFAEIVNWTIRDNYFLSGLAIGIDLPMVLTRIERNHFGDPGSHMNPKHRHIRSIYPEGVQIPDACCRIDPNNPNKVPRCDWGWEQMVNANWIVDNTFTNASGTESVVYEAGVQLNLTGNRFRNNNAPTTVQINGLLQVAIDGNRFEGNQGDYIIRFANSRHRVVNDGNLLVRMQNNYYDMQRCSGTCTSIYNRFVFGLDGNVDDAYLTHTFIWMGNESGLHFTHTDGSTAELTDPSVAAACNETGTPIYLTITGPFPIPDYRGTQTTNCSPAGTGKQAQFVTQSLPATMTPGTPYTVSVTMRNTGTESWPTGAGIKLGSRNPANNKLWRISPVELPGPVAAGAVVRFTFGVTAPSTPGAYNFQWQMLKEPGGWFGGPTANIQVPVVSPIVDDARFVLQKAPTTMVACQAYSVSITMRNAGATTWSDAGGYQLVAQRPQGNSCWGVSGVRLPSTTSVLPNGQVEFTFSVIAPTMPGDYTFEWRMTRNGLGFGDFTPAITVSVTRP